MKCYINLWIECIHVASYHDNCDNGFIIMIKVIIAQAYQLTLSPVSVFHLGTRQYQCNYSSAWNNGRTSDIFDTCPNIAGFWLDEMSKHKYVVVWNMTHFLNILPVYLMQFKVRSWRNIIKLVCIQWLITCYST